MCSLRHPRKLKLMLELFRPRSVLDVGCGTGWSIDFLVEHGVDVLGIEGSALAISKARHPECILKHNLNKRVSLQREFDVIWCMEVVEHIHSKYVSNILATLTDNGDRIVLSAARPGQGGEGHFNEQPFDYWIAAFSRLGFSYDEDATALFRKLDEDFCENVMVFFRQKMCP